MKRRFIGVFFTTCILFMTLPITAFANDIPQIIEYGYIADANTANVKFGENYCTDQTFYFILDKAVGDNVGDMLLRIDQVVNGKTYSVLNPPQDETCKILHWSLQTKEDIDYCDGKLYPINSDSVNLDIGQEIPINAYTTTWFAESGILPGTIPPKGRNLLKGTVYVTNKNNTKLIIKNVAKPTKTPIQDVEEAKNINKNLDAITDIAIEDNKLVIKTQLDKMVSYNIKDLGEGKWFPVLINFSENNIGTNVRSSGQNGGKSIAVDNLGNLWGADEHSIIIWLRADQDSGIKTMFIDVKDGSFCKLESDIIDTQIQ